MQRGSDRTDIHIMISIARNGSRFSVSGDEWSSKNNADRMLRLQISTKGVLLNKLVIRRPHDLPHKQHIGSSNLAPCSLRVLLRDGVIFCAPCHQQRVHTDPQHIHMFVLDAGMMVWQVCPKSRNVKLSLLKRAWIVS